MRLPLVGAALFALISLPSTTVAQQSFSCGFGTQGACLDYSDKVCNRSGMCVDKDAQCFSQFQCYPGGFVCKSDMDEVQKTAVTLATGYDDFRTCVKRAADMDDVSACVSRDNLR